MHFLWLRISCNVLLVDFASIHINGTEAKFSGCKLENMGVFWQIRSLTDPIPFLSFCHMYKFYFIIKLISKVTFHVKYCFYIENDKTKTYLTVEIQQNQSSCLHEMLHVPWLSIWRQCGCLYLLCLSVVPGESLLSHQDPFNTEKGDNSLKCME